MSLLTLKLDSPLLFRLWYPILEPSELVMKHMPGGFSKTLRLQEVPLSVCAQGKNMAVTAE